MSQNILAHCADIVTTSRIRQFSGPEISGALSAYTTDHFAAAMEGERIPVVVPVRNEQDDLPATLFSLARSAAAVPIVVLNGTTDNSGEVAEKMGAVVLEAPDGSRKVGATQTGMHYAHEVLGSSDALATDGDTLVTKQWPRAMRRRLAQVDQGEGAAVFATAITWHGVSRAVDLARTSGRAAYSFARRARNGLSLAAGYDYGLSFGSGGRVIAILDGMDPGQFVGDDGELQRRLIEAGVPVIGAFGLRTTVLTRGDRIGSLKDLVLQRLDANARRHASYIAQYGSDA